MSAVRQVLPMGFFNHSCFIRWLLLPLCIFLWRRRGRQKDARQSISLRCYCGLSVWLQLWPQSSSENSAFSFERTRGLFGANAKLIVTNDCFQIRWCHVSILRVRDPNAWAMSNFLLLITVHEFNPCAIKFLSGSTDHTLFTRGGPRLVSLVLKGKSFFWNFTASQLVTNLFNICHRQYKTNQNTVFHS